MTAEVDPLLPVILAGRTLLANNMFRAKLLAEASVTARRDPEGFKAYCLAHIEWSQQEAIARDRAGIPPHERLPAASGPRPDERAPLSIASLGPAALQPETALDEHAPLPWPIRKAPKVWLCLGGHRWKGRADGDTCCPECGRRPSTEAPKE